MATLTVQEISLAGLAQSLTAAASGGDQFVASSEQRHFFRAANGSGGSVTITIPAQKSTAQLAGVGSHAVDDITVAIADGAQADIGPITDAYIRSNDGMVEITYSSETSVTVGAYKLPRVAS